MTSSITIILLGFAIFGILFSGYQTFELAETQQQYEWAMELAKMTPVEREQIINEIREQSNHTF